MGTIHFGPKYLIENIKAQVNENKQTILEQLKIADDSLVKLQNHIYEMELDYRSKLERKDVELHKIKTQPIPERIVEVIKEVIVEKIVEKPVEIIKEVKVVEEKVIEKLVERVIEVPKKIIIEVPVEIVKSYIPNWIIILTTLQALFEAYLILK